MRSFLQFSILVSTIFTTLSLTTTNIEVKENSYQNVYIGLSSEVGQENCEELIEQLEFLMRESSSLIYKVTNYRVHFGAEVTVVLPKDFDCGIYTPTHQATPGWDFDYAPIRLGPSHPLFGDTIWTQQPGQCGEQGDFIYLTPDVVDNNSTFTKNVHKFVSEWAKFRWGIMEEVGHFGDPIYPPTYPLNSMNEFLPTACTDVALTTTNQLNCTSHSTCDLEIDPELNSEVKSSLLSVPELPNVTELCTRYTHVLTAPTKQNLLCDGMSAWEVFSGHSDYSITPGWNKTVPDVKIKTVIEQPIVATVLIAVEVTNNSKSWVSLCIKYLKTPDFGKEYIIDGICQAIRIFMQSGMYYKIVSFDDDTSNLCGMTIFGTDRPDEACEKLRKEFDEVEVSQRSIGNVLKEASKDLPKDSSIILITDGTIDPGEDLKEAVMSAGTNAVFPFVYMPKSDLDRDWYDELAKQTGNLIYRSSFIEAPTEDNNFDPTYMRYELANSFQSAFNTIQPDQIYRNRLEYCLTQLEGNSSCTVNKNVYEPLATYHMVTVFSNSIQFAYLDQFVNETCPVFDVSNSSYTFKCLTSLTKGYEVTVETSEPNQWVYVELLSVFEYPKDSTPNIVIRSIGSLHDLQYDKHSAPVLYGEAYHNGHKMYGSSIRLYISHDGRSESITLRDNGVGSDVTGNDGVFSGYLVGFPIVNASTDQIVLYMRASYPQNYDTVYQLPLEVPNETSDCCGSVINLPSGMVRVEDSVSIYRTLTAKITMPQRYNLPPGKITDLKLTYENNSLIFNFTAPGSDFDKGFVSSYDIVGSWSSSRTLNSHRTEVTDVEEGGGNQIIITPASDFPCGLLIQYKVSAIDEFGLSGNPSNTVQAKTECKKDEERPLQVWVIVSLSLAAIAIVVLGIFVMKQTKQIGNLTSLPMVSRNMFGISALGHDNTDRNEATDDTTVDIDPQKCAEGSSNKAYINTEY